MSEDERRDRLRSQTSQVGAVPGRDSRGEDTWFRSKVDIVLFVLGHVGGIRWTMSRSSGVVPNSKAISIMRSCMIDS